MQVLLPVAAVTLQLFRLLPHVTAAALALMLQATAMVATVGSG